MDRTGSGFGTGKAGSNRIRYNFSRTKPQGNLTNPREGLDGLGRAPEQIYQRAVSTEQSLLRHRTIREGKNRRTRKGCTYLDLDGGVFIWIKACAAAAGEGE
jgi:hypothetical protein